MTTTKKYVYICTANENKYCKRIDENQLYIGKSNGDKIIIIDNNGSELITYDSKNDNQNISVCVEIEKSVGNYYYYSAHFRRLDYLHYQNINTGEIKPESNLLDDFDDYVDGSYDAYSDISPYTFLPSTILKTDKTLYNEMFSKLLDSNGWEEIE